MQFQQDFILRVNGLPNNSESIRIEGQDATNGLYRGQTGIIQQGVEAIQEVAVQTSNYAAEFGQAAGGYFNFTMKSGTNQYHGSGYDYFVNEMLNAGLPYTYGDYCRQSYRIRLFRRQPHREQAAPQRLRFHHRRPRQDSESL
jgi:hypothetical protein